MEISTGAQWNPWCLSVVFWCDGDLIFERKLIITKNQESTAGFKQSKEVQFGKNSRTFFLTKFTSSFPGSNLKYRWVGEEYLDIL